MQAGQTATLGQNVLGYEWDEDLDNGFRPAGMIRMSETTQAVPDRLNSGYGALADFGPGTATHSLTLYRASSGALVFGAGTIQWSWGLDGDHAVMTTTPDPAMQQATVNLFADMGVQPGTLMSGLINSTQSTDIIGPTTTITAPANGTVITAGTAVTISGTATDTGGGVIGGVEVQFGRRTDVASRQRPSQLVPDLGADAARSRTVDSSARGPTDDSGNLGLSSPAVNVTVQLPTTSTSGLVAGYAFDEASGTTANNAAGSGNAGSIFGATRVAGHAGQALSFDGINDLVTIADNNSLDLTTTMTLEAWVKPADLQGWNDCRS